MRDTLPDTVQLLSSGDGDVTCSEDDQLVTCHIGPLDSADKGTVTIVVSPLKTGDIVNNVTVAANEHDPDTGDNSTSLSTLVKAVRPRPVPRQADPPPALLHRGRYV